MSKRMIGITFQVPSNVYYGLKKFLNCDNKTLARLFGACAINRLIDKGLLNEFGEPIEMPSLSTSLDFSSIIPDFPRNTFSLSSEIK